MAWDWRLKRFNKTNLRDDEVFQIAFRKCNLWRTVSMFWMIAEYIFVIVPFEASIIVIYILAKPTLLPCEQYEALMYSIISISVIVFSFAINPKRHMKCYRAAFTHIDESINHFLIVFQKSESNLESAQKDLVKAMSEGEKIINPSYDID